MSNDKTTSLSPVTTLDDQAANPVIVGGGHRTTSSETAVLPFAKASIVDPNVGSLDTLTIQLSGGGGTLKDGAGYDGLVSNGHGSYTLSGSATEITKELQALTFRAIDRTAVIPPATGAIGSAPAVWTTTFALSDTSTAGTSAANTETKVQDIRSETPVGQWHWQGVTPPPVPQPVPVNHVVNLGVLSPGSSGGGGGTSVHSPAGLINEAGPQALNNHVTSHSPADVSMSAQAPTPGSVDAQVKTQPSVPLQDYDDAANFATGPVDGGSAGSAFVFQPSPGVGVTHTLATPGASYDTADLAPSAFTAMADILRHPHNSVGGVTLNEPHNAHTVQLTAVSTSEPSYNGHGSRVHG